MTRGRASAIAAVVLVLCTRPTSLEGQWTVERTGSLSSFMGLRPVGIVAAGQLSDVSVGAVLPTPRHEVFIVGPWNTRDARSEQAGLARHLWIGALAGGILGGTVAQITVHRDHCEGCLPKWALVIEGVVLGAVAGALAGLLVHVVR